MNFRDGLPIYQQIADRLMDEILAEKYIPDERIPGVREYSLLLQVNVNTTVKAFDILARQGIIYNKRGLGSFVSADAVKIIRHLRSDDVLNGMLQELAKQMYLLGIPMEKVTDRLQQLVNEEMATPTVG
jgi:transcriptional regulator, gntR family